MTSGGNVQKQEMKSGTGAQERLLEAAMVIFGKDGYDAATTRAIAREAGTNIAAIPYYFNGKEGLYQAVIKHIVSLVTQQVDHVVQRVNESVFAGQNGRLEALALLEELISKLFNFLVGSPEGERFSKIILREQMYPTPAYDLIFKGFMEPVLDSIAVLIQNIVGDASERSARLRAMAIMGQVLAFRVARETVVRSLELKGYDAAELEEIRGIILEHTRNILNPFMS